MGSRPEPQPMKVPGAYSAPMMMNQWWGAHQYPDEFYHLPGVVPLENYGPGGYFAPSQQERGIQPGLFGQPVAANSGSLGTLLAMNTNNMPASPHVEDRRNLPRSPVGETSMFKGNPLGTPMEPYVSPEQLRTNSMFAPMRYDENGNLLPTNKPAPTWTRHGK